MNKKPYNKLESKVIGSRIKEWREKRNLTIPALSDLTEISKPTLGRLEDGRDVHLSYFIEVCKALKVHPKEVLNFEIKLGARNKLSPKQDEKEHLTRRINKLYQTDFFETPRFVSDVIKFLREEYNIKPQSKGVSMALKGFVDKKKLKFNLVGRKKQYFKKR